MTPATNYTGPVRPGLALEEADWEEFSPSGRLDWSDMKDDLECEWRIRDWTAGATPAGRAAWNFFLLNYWHSNERRSSVVALTEILANATEAKPTAIPAPDGSISIRLGGDYKRATIIHLASHAFGGGFWIDSDGGAETEYMRHLGTVIQERVAFRHLALPSFELPSQKIEFALSQFTVDQDDYENWDVEFTPSEAPASVIDLKFEQVGPAPISIRAEEE